MNASIIPVFAGSIAGTSIKLVNARELHAFLENKDMFSNWISDRINQFDFVENQDFISLLENTKKPQGGRPSKDYHITLDMAKELSMVERNAKGKQARRYFIDCEKTLLESKLMSLDSPTTPLTLAEFTRHHEALSNAMSAFLQAPVVITGYDVLSAFNVSSTPERQNTPWTVDDIIELQEYCLWGIKHHDIAKKMNRTLNSIRSAVSRYIKEDK